MTTLDLDTTNIVRRLAELQAMIADLTEQSEALKTELRSLPPADYDINGTPALRVTATRRFNIDLAVQMLTTDQRASCIVANFDPSLVKQHLTPVQVEQAMVESGKPKVSVL